MTLYYYYLTDSHRNHSGILTMFHTTIISQMEGEIISLFVDANSIAGFWNFCGQESDKKRTKSGQKPVVRTPLSILLLSHV